MKVVVNVSKPDHNSGRLFKELSDISLVVSDQPTTFVCTPYPGRLFDLVRFLRVQNVSYQIEPTDVFSPV